MKTPLVFLSLIVSASSLFAREPAWIFNNGPDARLISLGQGQLHYEVGLTKLIPSGTDLTLTVPMDADDAFPAAERPFFAVRYKYKTALAQAGLFFTTDTLTALSDKSYSSFPVVGDNTWRTAVVDMRTFGHKSWTGTITSFRFDPTNPSDTDSSYQVSRLGFFPSEGEARSFLEAAVDAPDYSEPTHFLAPLERVLVPGGCLSEGYDRADFMLQGTAVDQPSETTVVRFRPKGGGGEESVVPVCHTNRRGFTHFVARKAGKYRLVHEDVALDDLAGLAADAQSAIRFIVARRLLHEAADRQFRPGDPLADADWNAAAAALGEYDITLKTEARPATRAEAAAALTAAIQTALGTRIESPYTNEYLTRDRIRIGAWVSPPSEAIGQDFIETYSSGGFDWIIAHGALAGSGHRERLLRDCDRYGVELILGDGAFKNPAVATAEYFDHPCFAGTYVTDEPGTDQYDQLAEICNAYDKETGGKLPYINLLPMYANAAQLKYGASAAAIKYYDADPDLYKKYCDAFCQKFDPPYICTDIYPLNWTRGKRTTYPDYCESINIIATSAREHGKDFWCCIQTFAWVPSKRTPTESEFRWQSYCMLSFGCKGLLCWTYAGYKPDCPSLITIDGQRTNAWYDAATVFKEIRQVSDAFVRYKNLGALAHNGTDQTPYLKFSNPVQAFPTLQQIQCDDPLLVGCFAEKDGPGNALTIVNMSELEMLKTAQVKLKTAGSTAVAWPRGQRTPLRPDADGFYQLTLPPGEGVFVEVGRK
ncbi:MAG: hypothetical protein GX575_09480 [Candidatus Anammoximicrobium sp.]|nr:hypothetical protein [Candidatus Anammoximicrobium sp.]